MGSFKIPRAFFLSPWKKRRRSSGAKKEEEEEREPLNGMPLDDRRRVVKARGPRDGMAERAEHTD